MHRKLVACSAACGIHTSPSFPFVGCVKCEIESRVATGVMIQLHASLHYQEYRVLRLHGQYSLTLSSIL
jgi:hypothetical protein